MITFIKGIIEDISVDGISIDVSGVGYFIHISKKYLQELQEGEFVKIFTTLIHKEDYMKLYGFKNKEERELFNLLNSVSGIGNKTSIGILSEFNVADVITIIYSNDAKKLSKAPGVGLKTAQRVILELKEKISHLRNKTNISDASTKASYNVEAFEETEAALTALGYSDSEINSTIQWLLEFKKDLTKSDDLIREALIRLSDF